MKILKISLLILSTIVVFSCKQNKTANISETNSQQKNDLAEINTTTHVSDTSKSAIAFINVDSMLLNYKYYKELEDKLTSQYTKAEAEFNKKRASLEKEVMAFKQKEANNGFLSQESYQMQGQELMKKEQALQELNMKLTQGIEQHRAELNKQIEDTIFSFINNWNKTAGYDFILTKTSTIYARPNANITKQILDLLNQNYDKRKNKK